MPNSPPSRFHKPKKDGVERVAWMGMIVICVGGFFLCGAMIPAYLDDPAGLIALAALFAVGAFAAGRQF